MVKVKLVGLDPKTGKFKLSRKALMPRPESKPREEGGQGHSENA
jgi:polyribonucleotide nucleotidyltransferase